MRHIEIDIENMMGRITRENIYEKKNNSENPFEPFII